MPEEATATSFPARRPSQTARGLKAFWPLCRARRPWQFAQQSAAPTDSLPFAVCCPWMGTEQLGVGLGTLTHESGAWVGAEQGKHLFWGLSTRLCQSTE